MEIRKIASEDIKEVVDLWFQTSVQAHSFISPDYWKENRELMAKQYLPDSESYVAVKNGIIVGFVSMVENYLAAIFVQVNMQGYGIGKMLLSHVKKKRDTIRLKVYKKNSNSIQFYLKHGFIVLSEDTDECTDEIECLMEWKKN